MAASVLLSRSGRIAAKPYCFSSRPQNLGKRGRKKTVSWPSAEKLCEVRQFLAEDIPSSIGLNFLGSKNLSDETPLANRTRPEVLNTRALQCPFYHPQELVLDDSWLVAGGGESTEVSTESQREIRVLEAFYPRLASIPDSPAEPQECCVSVDDAHVPLIPLEELEIDDEEGVMMGFSEIASSGAANPIPNNSFEAPRDTGGSSKSEMPENDEQAVCIGMIDSNSSAIATVACMVVNALGDSDLVDRALLVKLLKNPSLLNSIMPINHALNYFDQNQLVVPKSSTVDHGSYSKNGSPESVLTTWGEDALNQSSATKGVSEVTQLSRHASIPSSISDVDLNMSKNAPNHIFPLWGPLQQQEDAQVQIGPPIACSDPNLQASSVGQDGRFKIETSCFTLVSNKHERSPNKLLMQAVSTPMRSHSLPNYECSLRRYQAGKASSSRRGIEVNKPNGLQRKTSSLGAPLQKAGARTKRQCIYFNTTKGCRKGGSCAFLHLPPNHALPI